MRDAALREAAEPLALPADTRPVIVKLGGSVVRAPELSSWLDAIVAARRPIVVVAGGGALADEVRACQAELGFGDPAAHRMALLAMDQLAWAIAGYAGQASSSARPRPSSEPRSAAAWSGCGRHTS